jgi:formylglycine-generating enzyme required for sulfatase activity
MRHSIVTMFVGFAILALVPGCKRQTPDEGISAPDNTPTAAETPSGIEMVLLPAGRFTMGDKNEIDAPPHEVALSAFHMDKYLVTQEQYRKIIGKSPARWKGDQNPVEQVCWSDAANFCNARSRQEGLEPCYDLETSQCNFDANGYRLPTEAEWEYACRAGTQTSYFFGNSPSKLSDYAWFDKNSGGHPQPVGLKRPNPWGLYDICGDIWQWCNDFYQVDYYEQAPLENPRGPETGDTRVVRGGSWKFSDDNCRSGYRYNESPGRADVCFGYDVYGFRCVRKASPIPPERTDH